jgi:hypothetical protein
MQNSTILGTNYPWVKGIHVCSNEGLGPLEMGDNHQNEKKKIGRVKVFFYRTSGPNLTRLSTNHPSGKGIQVSSSEGECPFPRGGNSKRVKIQ